MTPYQWGKGVKTRPREFPPSVLEIVTEKQGGKFCVYCHRFGLTTPEEIPLVIDHMQPLAKGGDNHWSNLQWCCVSHNCAKADGRPIRYKPKWAR